jgi:excisionase family DNA binding protein
MLTDATIAVVNPPLLSVRAAASYLGLGRTTFYGILSQFETIRIGGRRLVYRDSLDRFIADQRARAA